MPTTRATRSAARTSAPASPARPHVVDRALAVHALLAAGKPPGDVQRRLAKSKGYVSVLGYLGRALAGLEPEDLARLRAPALTPRAVWPLVTRARTDERAAVREALAAAATDAGRDQVRRRARDRATVQLRAALRAHVQAAAAGLAAPPRARGGRRPRAGGPAPALAFDPTAWAADPVAYAHRHLAALAAAHQAALDAALTAARAAAAERVLAPEFVAAPGYAGQSRVVGGLTAARIAPTRWRALADAARAGRTPAEEDALALLAHAARVLRLPAPREPHRAGPRPGEPPDSEVGPDDIDADLAE